MNFFRQHHFQSPEPIGIPRCLWYFLHPGLWEAFFCELGLPVVQSGATWRETIACAGLISEAEHCLPVKIHDAHLHQLAEAGVARVFVPRVLSTMPRHIACPKLGALPDCAIAQFGHRLSVVSVELDEARVGLRYSLLELAGTLGVRGSQARAAAEAGLAALAAQRRRWREQTGAMGEGSGRRILLLGHPYNLYDPYVSDPVTGKLRACGADFSLVDYTRSRVVPEPLKWDACSLMYNALRELQPSACAGVIQLSSFNCGCDSMAMEFYRDRLKRKGIPYMRLVLDEYEGRAGLDTRLEAFVDSIGW